MRAAVTDVDPFPMPFVPAFVLSVGVIVLLVLFASLDTCGVVLLDVFSVLPLLDFAGMRLGALRSVCDAVVSLSGAFLKWDRKAIAGADAVKHCRCARSVHSACRGCLYKTRTPVSSSLGHMWCARANAVFDAN